MRSDFSLNIPHVRHTVLNLDWNLAFLSYLILSSLLSLSSLSSISSISRYRLGYVALNVGFVALVASIPGSILWDERAGGAWARSGPKADSLALFLSAVVVSVVAFLVLQVKQDVLIL